MALAFAVFLADRIAYRTDRILVRLQGSAISEERALLVMRVAVAIFFTSLFIFGLRDEGFLLTPELKTGARWVLWLQLAIAVAAVSAVTLPAVGVGIVALYVAGAFGYGIYHMLDYLIFLGVAGYFLLSRIKGERWTTAREATPLRRPG